MQPLPTHQDEFRQLKACVLLPTYNNARTLQAVIEDVLKFTTNLIVINDGSTDNTARILTAYAQLRIINYADNRGKGYALRRGLRAAADEGYDYAITLDSDGQHFASDLPVFLAEIRKTPGALLVGARNMQVENVPAKSSFGNRFSNFWFWFNTHICLPDTQSGYRLYPVQRIGRKHYFTRKYEFEIEVLVRAAWGGVAVRAVPVSVYYPPAKERISHFRPIKDFSRISVLNTVLVLIALLWIKPRDLVMSAFTTAGWRRLWQMLFQHPAESNLRKAASVGFGAFMGIVPVWGFQLLIGIPLALIMRLNKGLFLVAANVSIFPFTVFWLAASLALGKWILRYNSWSFHLQGITLSHVRQDGYAFFLGGSALAVGAGLTAFSITWVGLRLFRRPATSRAVK